MYDAEWFAHARSSCRPMGRAVAPAPWVGRRLPAKRPTADSPRRSVIHGGPVRRAELVDGAVDLVQLADERAGIGRVAAGEDALDGRQGDGSIAVAGTDDGVGAWREERQRRLAAAVG